MPERAGARITQEQLEQLRRRLHEKVDQGIEKLLGLTKEGINPYELDFTGRESMVVEWGREVTAMLLEANVVYDGELAIFEGSVTCKCPRCGEPSPRDMDKPDQPTYDEVTLITRAGKVPLRLPQFRCPKCRLLFSPLPNQGRSPSGTL